MKYSSIMVSATNDFSIRLAHAKALNILSEGVTEIDKDTNSFIVNAVSTQEQELCSDFANWCHRLTSISENGLGIVVDILVDETPEVME